MQTTGSFLVSALLLHEIELLRLLDRHRRYSVRDFE